MPASGKIGNRGGGRKPLAREMAIIKYYEDLLPEAFLIAKDMLKSETKTDRLWAMDWLKSGFAKMIPQKIAGDPDNRTPIPLLHALRNNDSDKKDSPTE